MESGLEEFGIVDDEGPGADSAPGAQGTLPPPPGAPDHVKPTHTPGGTVIPSADVLPEVLTNVPLFAGLLPAHLRRMATANRLNIDAKHGNVDRLLPSLSESERRYDLVVLDPPRGGVGREGAAHIARIARERIVYISCDPATLARDLEAMLEVRPTLEIQSLRVFDMMPMTSEVESVVTLFDPGAPALASP